MRCGVPEAGHLLVLRRQVHDRVGDEVDEGEPCPRRSSWRSRRPSRRPSPRPASRAAARPSPPTGRSRALGTPRCASGSAIRPVPMPSSSACTAAGEIRQEVDDRDRRRQGRPCGRTARRTARPRARRSGPRARVHSPRGTSAACASVLSPDERRACDHSGFVPIRSRATGPRFFKGRLHTPRPSRKISPSGRFVAIEGDNGCCQANESEGRKFLRTR